MPTRDQQAHNIAQVERRPSGESEAGWTNVEGQGYISGYYEDGGQSDTEQRDLYFGRSGPFGTGHSHHFKKRDGSDEYKDAHPE